MRGKPNQQGSMVLSTLSPDKRVPKNHPGRRIKPLVDAALRALSPLFDKMYSEIGRPSIPPERLLKASLLMAFYSVRSERLFCERLDFDLFFRWFLDMDLEEPSFDHSTFSRNRQRLLDHHVAKEFLAVIVTQARELDLLSDEHFTVAGTLIEAWASLKSFKKKGADKEPPPDDPGNPTVNFHGEKRSNETHQSTTDPEARLARKGDGKEAKLSYCANALMENRHGLLVDVRVLPATGTAEREAAIEMLDECVPGSKRITVGGDKGYDTKDFVATCRVNNVTAHVAKNEGKTRRSAIDGRTTRHDGYAVSQRIRKRIEEVFGWFKTVGGFRRTRYRGQERTQFAAHMVGAAYNLMRMARMIGAPA